jgi:hypothetical protein
MINVVGTIPRASIDANGVGHGFVRSADGEFTIFDVPGGGTSPGQGTFAGATNPSGVTVGAFVDGNNVNHGFIRAKDGTITFFDVPAAGTGPGQETVTFSINPAGADMPGLLDHAGCNSEGREGAAAAGDWHISCLGGHCVGANAGTRARKRRL